MARGVVGAVVLMLALAGCGGDPKAEPSTTPSTPATSPVSTTPSAPVMPKAAKAHSGAGAIAFVKYFVLAFNHAAATGDIDPLGEASATACRSCRDVIDKVNSLYSSGGHSEGGVWRLVEVRLTNIERPWRVAGHVSYTTQRIVRPGSADQNLGGGEYDMEFTLQRRDGRWQVLKWVRH